MPTYATFPGLSQIVGASFTMSTGTTPSSGTIITVPHTATLPFYGNFEIIDQNHSTFIRLYDCVVEAATLTAGANTAQLWNLRVLDRRWKWRYGQISGHYNEPLRENEWKREKTPQQLASMLFEAMGESIGTYEVANLPNTSRPHVIWDMANPADELSRLCEGLGCRVVLSLSDNKARIFKRNDPSSAPLPTIGKEVSLQVSYARKSVPDAVNIVTAPSRYEGIWSLEAVGEETDGSYVPIDQLSYKPTWWGKDGQMPYFLKVTGEFDRDGKTIENRTLAQRSVYRCYRVKEAVGSDVAVFGLAPPGFAVDFPGETVDSIEQLKFFPNLNTLVSEDQGEIERKYQPALIMGIYFDTSGGSQFNTPLTLYRGDWSLDGEKGIVFFNDFVFKRSDNDVFPVEPAKLWLHATCEVKQASSGAAARYGFRWFTSGQQVGTPDYHVERSELVLRTLPTYIWWSDRPEFSNITDNKATLLTKANAVATEQIREFNQNDAGSRTYSGIWPINLDGALEQVSWSFSATQPAMTSVGRQMEVEIPLIGYDEKRSRQLSKFSALRQESERQKANRPDR